MDKKSYHHNNLKNELIEKGIELVSNYGLSQLSLRKVAQSCNVSHAAPYPDSTGYDQNQVEYENAAPCSCVQREAAKAQGTAGRIQASMRTMLQQKVFGVYLCR